MKIQSYTDILHWEYGHYLKSYAYFKKLPEMAEKLRLLEKTIENLTK